MTNNELFPLNSEKSESKGLKIILFQYIRFWYLFLICTALALGGAFLYLRYFTVPLYRVYSTMLIKDDKNSQADALEGMSPVKSKGNTNNEIEVLKSKSLMVRVITEQSLYTNYYLPGRFKDLEVYNYDSPIKVQINQIDPKIIGRPFTVSFLPNNSFILDDPTGKASSHKFGELIRKSYGTFTVLASSHNNQIGSKVIFRFQNIQRVAENYNLALIVQPISKESDVLALFLTDPIPNKAKDILTKLVEVYNREAIEDKNQMTANTLKFLDERLLYLTTGLSGVEKEVEKYKVDNGLTDINTQASTYTEQASRYNSQLSEWATQIDILESLENYLKKPNDNGSTIPSTLGISDGTLAGLIARFNELQLERERMLRTTEPANILVQNINEQLANLRSNILENLRNIKRGLQITSNNLRSNSGRFQSKVRRVPAMERQLLEINRQQSIKQNIYSFLLQKREETALALAATASTARVLDPATGGDYPISPNRKSIYLVALLLGLGMPVAGIYLASMLDNKVQSRQDVSNATLVPIIGEIAHNIKKQIVVVTKGNRSPIAEMFQLVRTNLHFAAVGKENVAVLVTSSTSGEGKTFFSINIAASLAATGKRAVLLDLDMRMPKVETELALPEGPGICDYLVSNHIHLEDILSPSEKVPGLFAIRCGPVPPNPIELMMSAKFKHFIKELKEQFDYIIMDSAPIGMVADSFSLSPFVDFTVYIVRYNHTKKAQLEIIANAYRNKTLTQPMIVLNDAKEKNGSNYGYGYGYGYGKEEASSKKTLSHKVI